MKSATTVERPDGQPVEPPAERVVGDRAVDHGPGAVGPAEGEAVGRGARDQALGVGAADVDRGRDLGRRPPDRRRSPRPGSPGRCGAGRTCPCPWRRRGTSRRSRRRRRPSPSSSRTGGGRRPSDSASVFFFMTVSQLSPTRRTRPSGVNWGRVSISAAYQTRRAYRLPSAFMFEATSAEPLPTSASQALEAPGRVGVGVDVDGVGVDVEGDLGALDRLDGERRHVRGGGGDVADRPGELDALEPARQGLVPDLEADDDLAVQVDDGQRMGQVEVDEQVRVLALLDRDGRLEVDRDLAPARTDRRP